jgi:hypothetical protein
MYPKKKWNFQKPLYYTSSNSNKQQKKQAFADRATPFLCYYGIQFGPKSSQVHLGFANNLVEAIEFRKKENPSFQPVILFTICGIPVDELEDFSKAVRKANDAMEAKMKHPPDLTFKLQNLKWKLEKFNFDHLLTLHCWQRKAIEPVFIENKLLGNDKDVFKWKAIDDEILPPMDYMEKHYHIKEETKNKKNKKNIDTSQPIPPNLDTTLAAVLNPIQIQMTHNITTTIQTTQPQPQPLQIPNSADKNYKLFLFD